MTAIAIGKNKKGVFAVVDAIVQMSLKVINHEDCRLQDKIVELPSSSQYITLVGEEIIISAANLLESWCQINKLKLDLFSEHNFLELLKCSDIYRTYSIEIQGVEIISQQNTIVYILSATEVKEYVVAHDGKNYIIVSSKMFAENKQIINYKGNVKEIATNDQSVILDAVQQLETEHEDRKNGNNPNKKPLQYDFMARFSTVHFENNDLVERKYPFESFSELFLSWGNDWKFVKRNDINYNPIIK